MKSPVLFAVWALAGLAAAGMFALGLSAVPAPPGPAPASSVPASPPSPAAGFPAPAIPGLPPGPPGRIVLDAPEFAFGDMMQQSEAKHTFVIRNKGEGILHIFDVTPSCGCTAAMPELRDIPAGGSTNLLVTFSSRMFVGEQHKSVTLRTNDPTQPVMQVKITANVHPMFVFEPASLDFGKLDRGVEAVREITVRETQGKPFVIEGIQVSHPDVQAAAVPDAPGTDGTSHRIHVTLKSAANPGPLAASLLIRINRPEMPTLTLVAQAVLQGSVNVWPLSVFVGMVKQGQAFPPQRLTIKNNTPTPVELKSIETGAPWLKAAVSPQSTAGFTYLVDLTVDPLPPPGRFEQKVKILTSESAIPLEITVSGVVRKSEEGAPAPAAPPPAAPPQKP